MAIGEAIWFCCGWKVFELWLKTHRGIALMYLLRRILRRNGTSQVSMVN